MKLANQEFKIPQLIIKELESLGIEVKSNIPKTGVLGPIRGIKQGKTVILVFHIDGVKSGEKTNVLYQSNT